MAEINWRQPRFTYSACGLFTKKQRKNEKFDETRDSLYIFMKTN